MGRMWGLATVWAVFAVAAIGVGFAAAGLVEYPRSAAEGQHPAGMLLVAPSAPVRAVAQQVPPATGSSADPPAAGGSPATTATPQPSPVRRPQITAEGDGLAMPAPGPGPSVSTRGISTAGGYVSGTCVAGVIRLSASPNAGWEVTDLSEPGEDTGQVGFELRMGSRGPHDTLEVEAWCLGGVPTFDIDVGEVDEPPGTESSDSGE